MDDGKYVDTITEQAKAMVFELRERVKTPTERLNILHLAISVEMTLTKRERSHD